MSSMSALGTLGIGGYTSGYIEVVDTDADFCTQFMENGALSNIIKPSRFGCFPEPLVAMYISQARRPLPCV